MTLIPITCTGTRPGSHLVSGRWPQPLWGPLRRPLEPRFRRPCEWLLVRVRQMTGSRRDAGMTTAEYAIGTVAACGFAAVLYRVVTSSTVSGAVSALLTRALNAV